jgi:hypothetical protein
VRVNWALPHCERRGDGGSCHHDPGLGIQGDAIRRRLGLFAVARIHGWCRRTEPDLPCGSGRDRNRIGRYQYGCTYG